MKYVADSALTAALSGDQVVCLHGAQALDLTSLALNAALDVAAQGKKSVYIACEGELQLSATLTRLKTVRQVSQVRGLFVLAQAVDMLKAANVTTLAGVIARKVGRPDLIVLDCLAYCFGADELDPKAMARFVANLHELQAITGAHVLLLHRTGHASVRGPRSTAVPPDGLALVGAAA